MANEFGGWTLVPQVVVVKMATELGFPLHVLVVHIIRESGRSFGVKDRVTARHDAHDPSSTYNEIIQVAVAKDSIDFWRIVLVAFLPV